MNMKRKGIFLPIAGLVMTLTAAFGAETSVTNWSVTVINQLLAKVPPGHTTVLVGDMLLPVSLMQGWRDHLAGGPQPRLAFSGSFAPWTGGAVYYSFSNNVSAVKQQACLDAMAEWAMFANLHFVPWTTQANYVTIFEASSLEGGQSNIGMAGGQQFVQIGPTSWNRATLCHELGHTLGLIHEQQRSDRDSYVTILTTNIAPGAEGNFILLPDSLNQTAYDFLSVMHYARNGLSVDPSLDTIQPVAPYLPFINVMGRQFDPVLSASDRAGMAAVYGPGPTITNLVSNTLDSGPGSLRAALYYAFDHPGSTIAFNIPIGDPGFSNNVFNILPTDALPGLWGQTTLDGSTEPVQYNNYGPQVVLNGALGWLLDIYPNGLRFRGTNSVACGLVINNFPGDGVYLDGPNTVGNVVSGCYLGIDETGGFPITNGYVPVEISGGAAFNIIGGTTASARNIISGSAYQGISLHDPGTSFNVLEGNYIGLDSSGTISVSNTWEGVQIWSGAQSNLVGGFTAAARNVISGNGLQGVLISDTNTSGNVVAGNYLGLNFAGVGMVPNGWSGVDIYQSPGNVIGPANVLSGNGNYGVSLSQPGAVGNMVGGNIIGLNASASFAAPNQWGGVALFDGAQSNVIGGALISARNLVSGNSAQGVVLGGVGTAGNWVTGNYIGVNSSGDASIGNGWAGVDISGGATGNTVGGNLPGQGNVISGNFEQGVLLQDVGTGDNLVQGNLIGLNAAGSQAVSNTWAGVEITGGAAGNLIGGYGGARNFISGNGIYGVYVDSESAWNIIQGNTLGLDIANGVNLPNNYANVAFYEASSNLVGGVFPGAANLVAGSTGDGVGVLDAASTNNTIRGNSIFGNPGLAIAAYGGGNGSLPAPELASAVVGTNTVVSGSYSGAPAVVYLLDFYSDAPPSGSSQAKTYLGSIPIVGTGAGAPFAASLGVHLPAGRVVSATATDAFGNTSQLSPGVMDTMFSTPNDGIPDAWRAEYFGGTGAATNGQSSAFADPDHDGMDNYQEFLAGTNPTNAASIFILAAFAPNASARVVRLNSASGTVYRLWACDDLSLGYWQIIADQVVGTGDNMFFYDPAALALAHRFYQAEVLW